ncbi:hypothetical protein PHMEG_0001129 [Phytophthora megakarya]|uniref:Orc1-like AAA ATPase domain-containing protein n=1 Tax=Phytophthora megakarya TaxID=4795 RepID=A0A225X195_9STRA|nr:hypothetical protein PHMEG_0001129 [Phytophthora megakarya]
MPNSGSELNILLRHVPKIVVSRFLTNRNRPGGPESLSFLATVALFDISGFSSLGSRLSEDERRQSRDTNNNCNGTNAPVTSTELNSPRSPLSSRTRSSSGNLLHRSPSKGRISQPTLQTVPSLGGPSTNIFSSSSRELSTRKLSSSSKCDNDNSLEGEENLNPSEMMRQRRHTSMTNMSFVHGSRTSVATQGIAVETLTTSLNKSLEPVIEVILKHGGDIIKFAGDALIVMWETEASRGKVTPAGELVYRAVCCALEALQALKGAITTSNEQDAEQTHLDLLGMHVGIGVSNMTGNHVGGVLNRWEFYLSGDANRQMSFAEENAKKGQLALSPEAFDALDTRFGTLPELDVVCHSSGNYLVLEAPGDIPVMSPQRTSVAPPLEASADLIGFLRCYVPGAIVSHLQKGLTLTPCRLNVTVAFVKLEGVIEIKDSQKQLQTIHQNLCTIQECAYKAQGMLRQFVIDDKGAVAIVAIGLPPFFHENNAFRGIKFASYILESGVKASIGARAEYAVVGDSINLAARLMAAAPVGEIYCDDWTYKETKNSVQFRDTLEMTVKGKSNPIQVFPVQQYSNACGVFTSSSLEATCPAPYMSSDILDAVPMFSSTLKCSNDANTHRALVVCGDSGTGKTMLINHVVQRHSLQCFKGSGDSMDTAVDFHAWRGIAKALAMVTVKVSQNKTSVPSIEMKELIRDIGQDSTSATVHRPSLQTRRSRTSTLTTHDEGSELDHDNQQITTCNKEHVVTSGSQRVTILDYLLMHQQVTKETLKTLRNWFPYGDTATSESTEVKGEGILKSFRQVLFSIIAVLSTAKPIMLVFDDAQWMDNRSLSLVLKVLEELPNVYFLITVRGMTKHTASARSMLLALVMSLPSVDTRQMNCFSYQQTSLFLCQQYHITIMDTQVLHFVFERTEGNPGSLIKLMTFMLDAKYIAIEPETNNIVILKDLDEMDTLVPQHIRARVMSIVNSLDSLAQTALKLLSINPQPSEERMVDGILTILSGAYSDGSMTDASGIRLKITKPTSEVSLLRQVRESLVPCEKVLLTIDPHNNLYFFNTEEMRLVVYDTMLPSQRKVLHGLYADWLRSAASKPGRDSISLPPLAAIRSMSSAENLTTMIETPRTAPVIRPVAYQQLALQGYHLSQSDNPKEAVEAYYVAAERAMDAKELGFAEDCMHTSSKILNTHPRINDLSDLDTILLRSRIEFIRGTIAVENNDLNLAITHLSYITRLFNRKGSILRYYTINVQREGLPLRSPAISYTDSRRTSFPRSTVDPAPTTPGCFGIIPESPGVASIPRLCMPRLFSFNNIAPTASRSVSPLGRRQIMVKAKRSKTSGLLRPNRIQAEQTLEALDHINFYRRKASALIKQINYAKKKEEEMHRHIQKFAQRSLQAKDKR